MKHSVNNMMNTQVRRIVLYWRTDTVLASQGRSINADEIIQARMANHHRTIAAGKLVGEIRKWRRHMMMSAWHYFRQHFVEAAALKAAMVWASVAKRHARDMEAKAADGAKAALLKAVSRALQDQLGRRTVRYIFIWHMNAISTEARNVFAVKGIEHHDHSHDDHGASRGSWDTPDANFNHDDHAAPSARDGAGGAAAHA